MIYIILDVTTAMVLERHEPCPYKMVNLINKRVWGFSGGAVVESRPANAGDTGSSPGLGRSHMPQSN